MPHHRNQAPNEKYHLSPSFTAFPSLRFLDCRCPAGDAMKNTRNKAGQRFRPLCACGLNETAPQLGAADVWIPCVRAWVAEPPH